MHERDEHEFLHFAGRGLWYVLVPNDKTAGSVAALRQRWVGCENHAPKGVAIALPGWSNRREKKAVLYPALSPSGA